MTTQPPLTIDRNRNGGPDPVRSRMRATVARIEHALSALPGPANSDAATASARADAVAGDGGAIATVADAAGPSAELRAAWADLVGQLALGPEPALRACPRCHQLGMRAATLCGHCWAALTPLAGDHA